MNRKTFVLSAILGFAAVMPLGVQAEQQVSGYELAEDEFLAGKYTVELSIRDYGTVTMELDADTAPVSVTNFYRLCSSDFYDGLTFHRIIEGFMMQGGDPLGNGTGGSEENIKGEFSANGVENELSHTRGAVSMARAQDMDSASSQFFICHEDATFLDGQYACFGYVTEGMDVVDQICTDAEPTDGNGSIKPEDQPVIEDIVFLDTEVKTQPASEVDWEINVVKAFDFTAETMDGEEVKFSDFANAKLVIVNLWEPWCGPCVKEMPDLEKLYETYKDKGLAVVGVFESTDMMDDARAVVKDNGITYPIVKYTDDFKSFLLGYVPVTGLFDGAGNMLTAQPIVGALTYEQWESLVSQVL